MLQNEWSKIYSYVCVYRVHKELYRLAYRSMLLYSEILIATDIYSLDIYRETSKVLKMIKATLKVK